MTLEVKKRKQVKAGTGIKYWKLKKEQSQISGKKVLKVKDVGDDQ